MALPVAKAGDPSPAQPNLLEAVGRLFRDQRKATSGVASSPDSNLKVDPSTGVRLALVIGNSAYPDVAALRNPVNDATDIAAKLADFGFSVTLKTDLPLRQMLRTLTEFGDKIQPGTEVLVFYAGHGMQVRGKNYLIPIDAEIRSEASVSSEAVDVDQLLDKFSPARMSLVILDACRHNPFERRFRGGGQGLAQINAPSGTLIAYATAPGRVAADGEGRNGLYTEELLAAMDIPGIKVEDVFKRVRGNVIRKSNEAQTPWESSSLTGDFYFKDSGGKAEASPVQSVELTFWDSIKESKNPEDYKAYLDKFPNGNFVTLAKNRIAESETRNADLSPAKDSLDGIWQGQLETYGGLVDKPIKVAVKVMVVDGRILGEVFMYGENRKITGSIDSSGRLTDAKLAGTLQSYTLSGTLPQIHGEGLLGWKLKIDLKKSN